MSDLSESTENTESKEKEKEIESIIHKKLSIYLNNALQENNLFMFKAILNTATKDNLLQVLRCKVDTMNQFDVFRGFKPNKTIVLLSKITESENNDFINLTARRIVELEDNKLLNTLESKLSEEQKESLSEYTIFDKEKRISFAEFKDKKFNKKPSTTIVLDEAQQAFPITCTKEIAA